jgi:hypothetical protein
MLTTLGAAQAALQARQRTPAPSSGTSPAIQSTTFPSSPYPSPYPPQFPSNPVSSPPTPVGGTQHAPLLTSGTGTIGLTVTESVSAVDAKVGVDADIEGDLEADLDADLDGDIETDIGADLEADLDAAIRSGGNTLDPVFGTPAGGRVNAGADLNGLGIPTELKDNGDIDAIKIGMVGTLAAEELTTQSQAQSLTEQELLPEQLLPEQLLPEQLLPEQSLPEQSLPEQSLPEQLQEQSPEQSHQEQTLLEQTLLEQSPKHLPHQSPKHSPVQALPEQPPIEQPELPPPEQPPEVPPPEQPPESKESQPMQPTEHIPQSVLVEQSSHEAAEQPLKQSPLYNTTKFSPLNNESNPSYNEQPITESGTSTNYNNHSPSHPTLTAHLESSQPLSFHTESTQTSTPPKPQSPFPPVFSNRLYSDDSETNR